MIELKINPAKTDILMSLPVGELFRATPLQGIFLKLADEEDNGRSWVFDLEQKRMMYLGYFTEVKPLKGKLEVWDEL